ncbi:pyridoxal-phosphate dependent enzyme [Pseudonocardia sp. KRD291]|uniref:pyridoxal-phosphate dependent enzyme n=1 Tax=Pseudonocardia sp. KRD291 TaxID=2792007 RepID=UPI001C49D119|nr:pyridoxal-phosphate dependent enzyme [Pseudonocardia sp. KRD291]MBW0102231.1 pyridoxal-phosphate dependent enzyme [Pseudonocardia sp. KRD291]
MPQTSTAPTEPYTTPTITVDDLLPGVRVFLKDETRYASGSHKEPAARALVARAIADGHERVVVGSCGSYGRAMATACAAAGLRCTVVLPAGWSDGGAFAGAAGSDVHLVRGGYEDAVDESRRLAHADGAVDGNVDGPYKDVVLEGHGHVVRALRSALGGAPAALWIPVGNGTTVVAAHRQARALGWPVSLHGVGSPGNNPIVTSWPGPYRMLPSHGVVTTEHNEPLVNWHSLHGPDALAAVAESRGAVHAAADDELLAARALLARYGAHPTPAGSAALAGLLAHARTGPVTGSQVVLLSGR